MKRIAFLIVGLIGTSILFAQSRPDWMDDDLRAMQYPDSRFIVGFAMGNILDGEDAVQATERIKNAAQENLLENIHVDMLSHTESFILSENRNGRYIEEERLVGKTAKSSAAEIVGMKVESYRDKKTKNIYVFVYANRGEVFRYHRDLIQDNLSKVDGMLAMARSLFAQNRKSPAREKCDEAMALFSQIDQSQKMLVAIGGNGGRDGIQMERAMDLFKVAVDLQSQLDPKYEIVENLKIELIQKLQQIEGLVGTCVELLGQGEKIRAKRQCESAQAIIPQIRELQESIREADPSVGLEFIEQARVEKLRNEVEQLSAQLSQPIMVYVEGEESLFEKPVSLIASKLKSQLASDGCSFVADMSKADFKLAVVAAVREGDSGESLVFCYSDVQIDLYDVHKQKSIYSDSVSAKGGSTTKEKAARKAMENAAQKVASAISPWLK